MSGTHKIPRVRLGMQALCITMKGVRATRAELYALQSAAQACSLDARKDGGIALLRRAALDAVDADPLTDDHIESLRSALSAFIAPKRDAHSIKPEYDWQKRKDLA